MLEHLGVFDWGVAVMIQSFAWRKKNSDAKKKWWATHQKEGRSIINKLHKANLGKPSWNLGLTKETDERVKKISDALLRKHPFRGKHQSKKSNKQRSLTLKSRTDIVRWNKGLTKNIDRRLMKISRLVSIRVSGKGNPMYGSHRILDKNPNWLGGKSFEPYGNFNEDLKDKIRKRDGYKCQICKTKQNGKKHCVHHIDYDKKNCSENNLITLCNSCHMKTGFNRKKWINYFTRRQI